MSPHITELTPLPTNMVPPSEREKNEENLKKNLTNKQKSAIGLNRVHNHIDNLVFSGFYGKLTLFFENGRITGGQEEVSLKFE